MSARVELEWITPLPWADPPFEIVQRIRREVSASIPNPGGNSERAHRVSAEFHRRLKVLDILVEGA